VAACALDAAAMDDAMAIMLDEPAMAAEDDNVTPPDAVPLLELLSSVPAVVHPTANPAITPTTQPAFPRIMSISAACDLKRGTLVAQLPFVTDVEDPHAREAGPRRAFSSVGPCGAPSSHLSGRRHEPRCPDLPARV